MYQFVTSTQNVPIRCQGFKDQRYSTNLECTEDASLAHTVVTFALSEAPPEHINVPKNLGSRYTYAGRYRIDHTHPQYRHNNIEDVQLCC